MIGSMGFECLRERASYARHYRPSVRERARSGAEVCTPPRLRARGLGATDLPRTTRRLVCVQRHPVVCAAGAAAAESSALRSAGGML